MRGIVDEMAQQGMRVLGAARAFVPACSARPESPRGFPFEFLGPVGIADSLRPTVSAPVEDCRAAGIRVVMITGDYPQTARALAFTALVAANLGLVLVNRSLGASILPLSRGQTRRCGGLS